MWLVTRVLFWSVSSSDCCSWVIFTAASYLEVFKIKYQPEASYCDSDFHVFPKPLQTNSRTVHEIKPQFHILSNLLIILTIDTI
jgi:hypothetical protein